MGSPAFEWVKGLGLTILLYHILELAAEDLKPVTAAEGRLMAAKVRAHSYHECSAKESDNVEAVFAAAARAAAQGRNSGVGDMIKSKCRIL